MLKRIEDEGSRRVKWISIYKPKNFR